jgi:hypothetical protein
MGFQPEDRGNQIWVRKSGSLWSAKELLMGLGIAEIGKHAIAHLLCDEPAVALDQLRAAAVIGTDDPP